MAHSKFDWQEHFRRGTVIPAHPLALTEDRKLDERRQRALTRYYLDAGAGGIAVGVHTTQFEIRDPRVGLFEPVLALAAETARSRDAILVAGICGRTGQAVREAEIAADLGYHAGLLSLAAFADDSIDELIRHTRAVGEVLPVIGFYLQPAVGGRALPFEFWRRFAEVESVKGIKIAPFNRYATLDVIRGVAESGRSADVALYTGNDDHIVADLLTPFRFGAHTLRIAGGLLGHWAVWAKAAVELHAKIRRTLDQQNLLAVSWLTLAEEVTDMNAAIFDVANHFHGCIAGIHEVLRRQGLLAGTWCLNPAEGLSPGQAGEIDRVILAYPHLIDDEFVKENLHRWLA
ncbi:MAG TPA: dihydrodipicolinate synthase family protein [Bryobacteraceae bacterium]|jgi:dihydrodipicolinate synthase/N-acetylneuraminate lyase|nr:dihydrodipicolinate synthase family protein [Bryobacteraceae bacterium]